MDKPNTPQDDALRARAQAEYDKFKANAASHSASTPHAQQHPGQHNNGQAAQPGASPFADSQAGPSAPSSAPNSAEEKQPTIGSLVADLSAQASSLVRGELEYAQANIKGKITDLGIGGVFLAVAGVVALYAFGMLLATFGYALSTVMPVWLSFLIVTLVLFLIVAIFVLLGIKKLKSSKKYVVSPSDNLSKDVAAIKNGMKK
ncbi:MAG: phage holin family protein [Actinomycetaceae bacterium]|nr:phage holin family protein [Actinomycetaceae bacterium]